MAEIVNLRQARKARKRLEDQGRAAANRLAHGRTMAERQATEMAEKRLQAIVDGARLEHGDD